MDNNVKLEVKKLFTKFGDKSGDLLHFLKEDISITIVLMYKYIVNLVNSRNYKHLYHVLNAKL